MYDYENRTFEGLYYSQFIAAWVKSGGKINRGFRKYLESLKINGKNIPEDVIREIYILGDDGKLELEEHAKQFMKTLNKFDRAY